MPKKKVGSTHTASNGARYRILPNGRARFISGPTKGHKRKGGKRKRKGGSAAVGGSARVGGGLGLSKKMNPYVYKGLKAASNYIMH